MTKMHGVLYRKSYGYLALFYEFEMSIIIIRYKFGAFMKAGINNSILQE